MKDNGLIDFTYEARSARWQSELLPCQSLQCMLAGRGPPVLRASVRTRLAMRIRGSVNGTVRWQVPLVCLAQFCKHAFKWHIVA